MPFSRNALIAPAVPAEPAVKIAVGRGPLRMSRAISCRALSASRRFWRTGMSLDVMPAWPSFAMNPRYRSPAATSPALAGTAPQYAIRRWPSPRRWSAACPAPAALSVVTASAGTPMGSAPKKTSDVPWAASRARNECLPLAGPRMIPSTRRPRKLLMICSSLSGSQPWLAEMTAVFRSHASSSIARRTAAENGSAKFSTRNPSVSVLPFARLRFAASGLGW